MQNLSGSVLVQRFRLDSLESQNEWGEVYRGADLKRNFLVSVTVLRNAIPYDPTVLSFQQSNLTLQTLSHPHIAPFYGLYQDQNIAFLVERYVDGAALEEILRARRGRPVSLLEAMIYLKSLCAGLGYAHRFGLVHCNVRPSNVRVERSGNILLGGFGFARAAESVMTTTGVLGVPSYLAPEEIRRELVTPATDIYGLGLLLFELLTGQHPFLGSARLSYTPELSQRLITAHLLEPAPNPRLLNPTIPEGFAQVILTALAKDPRERYQNTQEMLEVGCAVTSYTPDQLPDRLPSFPAPSEASDETLIVAPSGAPSTLSAEQRPGETMPVFGVSQPESYARQPSSAPDAFRRSPGGTVVVPIQADEIETPVARKRIAPLLPYALAIGAGLIVCLCLAVIGLAAFPTARGLFTIPVVNPSATVTSTLPFTPLPTTQSAATSIPFETPGALLTDTPPPTHTPPPTQTPAPTNTPAPSPTPLRTAFTVTIRNNLGYPIYAFRDGQLMGTDPIPPARYIYYLNIPAGVHIFYFCANINGTDCTGRREVNVNQDLTITVP
jgi:serine/threonine protein kinase